jgi:hypothetical protein
VVKGVEHCLCCGICGCALTGKLRFEAFALCVDEDRRHAAFFLHFMDGVTDLLTQTGERSEFLFFDSYMTRIQHRRGAEPECGGDRKGEDQHNPDTDTEFIEGKLTDTIGGRGIFCGVCAGFYFFDISRVRHSALPSGFLGKLSASKILPMSSGYKARNLKIN